MLYKISMPDRQSVIYEDCESEILFEVEVVLDGVVLYTNSPKFMKGDEKDLVIIINKVRSWLESKFSEVTLDDSPPLIFDL